MQITFPVENYYRDVIYTAKLDIHLADGIRALWQDVGIFCLSAKTNITPFEVRSYQ